MHGIKFSKLIGDGDSRVTKRLPEILPYGQAIRVEKIECRNYLLRNYSQKMMSLTKRTEFPIEIRKKIVNNIIRMRTDITCAIKFRKAEDKHLHQKIAGLRFDIANAPNHRIFDYHENCSTYFCDKKSIQLNDQIKKLAIS
ncbi:unnamed protein product [Macrosiphum euphorbiae]|uniref:Mutator-like transposase domain-containing protein n=1 Tax=Macrosiphum euphorbiae TaxID=13131 RepID=A0AAV0WPR9_9HEMI|nr:unnamed protein product [Macrosiphum euphorbiae]